jgi:tripartite-type tricarboxylate transporter receptor subunit TctC
MKLLWVLIGLVSVLLAAPAAAQYPNKPVRFIVASGAGGSPDIRAGAWPAGGG